MDKKTERLVLVEKICMDGIANSFIIMLGDICIGQITICSNKEICYEILKEYSCKGYATEALKEVMKIAFENGREPILIIDNDNIPSMRVANKAGFKIQYDHGEWAEWIAAKKPE